MSDDSFLTEIIAGLHEKLLDYWNNYIYSLELFDSGWKYDKFNYAETKRDCVLKLYDVLESGVDESWNNYFMVHWRCIRFKKFLVFNSVCENLEFQIPALLEFCPNKFIITLISQKQRFLQNS